MNKSFITLFFILVKLVTIANSADTDTIASNNGANNIMSYGIIITIMSVAFIVTTVMRGVRRRN